MHRRYLCCRFLKTVWMELKTWWGTNAMWRSPDSKLGSLPPHSLGFSHATCHFSESTHRSSPPTVVKSDNPISAAILNGLFRSEVSQGTVCTASPAALTRLCRFMQMRSNPWEAGDSVVFKSVSWPFLCRRSWGGRGVMVNERGRRNRWRQREGGWERRDQVLEEEGEGRLDEWEDESERAAARR